MANPYAPPSETESNVASVVRQSTWQLLPSAFFLALFFSLLGLSIHALFGIPILEALIENQIWILLIIATTSLIASLVFKSNGSQVHIAKLACSIAGLTVLILHGLTLLSQFVFGAPLERLTYYQRAFGEYFWIYWAVVGILGCLPLIFVVSRVRNSVWLSTATLLAIAISAVLFLRANYAVNYSDPHPTSWLQFFWPF